MINTYLELGKYLDAMDAEATARLKRAYRSPWVHPADDKA